MTVYKGNILQKELSQGNNTFVEIYKGSQKIYKKSEDDILPFYGYSIANNQARYLLFGNFNSTGILALYDTNNSNYEYCTYQHYLELDHPIITGNLGEAETTLKQIYVGYFDGGNSKSENKGNQTDSRPSSMPLYYVETIYRNVSIYYSRDTSFFNKAYWYTIMFNNSKINDFYFTFKFGTGIPEVSYLHPTSFNENEVQFTDKNGNIFTLSRYSSYDGYFSKNVGFVFYDNF